MKTRSAKITALVICVAMLAAAVGITAFAANSQKNDTGSKSPDLPDLIRPTETADIEKNETVYVIAGADGSVKKIIVSDWIKNNSGNTVIRDDAALSDVTNVKGDETYTMADGSRVWNAEGNDIYCQGSTDRELPVVIAVSYTLDGKTVSADELAGKSGRVTVRFDYKNQQYEAVEIDGKKEKIYVPFVMLTGMLLDGDRFSNVEVTNGKLVNDGDRIAVVGIAFPGLGDDLGISADKYEIPDYVEMTADVKDFKMTNTVTVAVGDLFGRLNTDALDTTDINDAIGKLTDSMTQLTDGADALYGGLGTLLEKSGELAAGIDKLAAGAEQLKNGAGQLADGSAQLAAGAGELAAGLGTLSSNSASLNAGAAQVFDSLLAAANSQLAAAGLEVPTLTRDNYGKVLAGVIASLDEAAVRAQAEAVARATVEKAVEAKKGEISAAVTAAVRAEVSAKVASAVRSGVEDKVLASLGMSREQYEAGVAAGAISAEQQAGINAAVDAAMQSAEVAALTEANTDAEMQSETVKALIAAKTDEQAALLVEQNMQSEAVKAQINAAVEKATAGAASITALRAQLDSYNEFYTGLARYTAGVDSAKAGADSLNDGAASLAQGAGTLKAGIDELCEGILTLKNGVPALIDGVGELHDGAGKLSDGLKRFNEEGVGKIVDAVDGDLAGLMTRIKATADVSRDYRTFTGLSDGMGGQVKFIYRTDSISE